LEEVSEADLILHVRDISHPETAAQRRDVLDVLSELGREENGKSGLIEVLNKTDLIGAAERDRLVGANETGRPYVPISALREEGLGPLLTVIDQALSASRRVISVKIELADGATIAWLYRHGEVLNRSDDDVFAHFRVGLSPADADRLHRRRKDARGDSQGDAQKDTQKDTQEDTQEDTVGDA
jgi:GTP-binding protein HflX